MPRLARLLNNIYKNKRYAKYFNDIEGKNELLNANTAIPNQGLPTSFNKLNEPTTIFFTNDTAYTLQQIAKVSYNNSLKASKENAKDYPIEFFCYGYQDFDGDVIITGIEFPSIKQETYKSTATVNRLKHIDITSKLYDYLYRLHINKRDGLAIGDRLVALYGSTKSFSNKDNNRYCATLGEMSESIVPGDLSFNRNILSGTIIIPPKVFEPVSFNKFTERNGSIEVALIDYQLEKSGKVTPTSIKNVTRAIDTDTNKEVEISKSPQVYNASIFAKDERTM